jgi:maltose/maltodextrin transport system substrate-binding protein
MKRLFMVLSALCLVAMNLFAWTNDQLLIWMDSDRGDALKPIAKRFEDDWGIKVKAPEKITDGFSIAAQAGKGPDIVMWAHDKLGERVDAGLIAPVEVSEELLNKFFPKAWQAVLHEEWFWAYPVALETVTLIYNKKLLSSPPPSQLSDLVSLNQETRE